MSSDPILRITEDEELTTTSPCGAQTWETVKAVVIIVPLVIVVLLLGFLFVVLVDGVAVLKSGFRFVGFGVGGEGQKGNAETAGRLNLFSHPLIGSRKQAELRRKEIP